MRNARPQNRCTGANKNATQAAATAGKPAAGFETGKEQIAFLDGMDAAEQVQLLDEALANAQPGHTEVDTLHALWRAGDAAALWDRMARDMQRKYPRLYRRINVERNDAWLPDVEGDTLAVVGALHLLGDDGLVEKLRDRGYEVERICSACAAR